MPSTAERMIDEARLLDGHTYIMFFLVAAQYVTNALEAREKVSSWKFLKLRGILCSNVTFF